MHQDQINFCKRIKERFPNYFNNVDVIDVGSMDINGNNRYLFTNSTYLGIDLGKGKNVDIIAPHGVHTVEIDSAHVVISTECLEHDKHYLKTLEWMIKHSKQFMLFTCATTGRPEHGTTKTRSASSPFTNDYYKNLTQEDLTIDWDKYFKEYEFKINKGSKDLYFWGIKK